MSRERALTIHRIATSVPEAALDPGRRPMREPSGHPIAITTDIAQLQIVVAVMEQTRGFRVVRLRAGLGGFGVGAAVVVVGATGAVGAVGDARPDLRDVMSV